ncbi:Retrovirus-related Pol polyprotein [Stylophora pistillata]|uniref:Retrovirus-related Pol polyprotein n=1 Tax=Stylophora pistillata TaxID=50429 RepID=A0A2B4SFU5_STYPI|nr:Retrovirus-related Pol polyprotein [Stylophora pistillata]
MGMVNQMAKFIPNLANLNEPLRQLLKKGNMWKWDKAQQQSCEGIKNELTSATNLAHYDPSRPAVISSDASNIGLEAVLLQLQEDGTRKPVYYASRSLSETEKRYAVIEKEALAVTWACDKFSDYVLGMKFTVETDHKPLAPLFNSTDLSKMPPRILRFRMRLMKYELNVVYVPGKEQITPDTLSGAPIKKNVNKNIDLVEEVESFTQQIVARLPATPMRLQDISEAQDQDELPTFPDNLQPNLRLKDLAKLDAKKDLYRSNQKSNHDRRYKANDLPELQSGEKVWIRDQDRMARVLAASLSPRSYILESDKGTQLRRNRATLVSADTCTKTFDTQPEANFEKEMLRK